MANKEALKIEDLEISLDVDLEEDDTEEETEGDENLEKVEKDLEQFAASDPQDSLTIYLKTIQKFPMLRAEEELSLAQKWLISRDEKAAQQLVNSHLRLVAKIAMGYKGYGLPLADLISEGSVGIMEALRRFDPEKGARLSTYASWWIRASIKEYVLKSWSLVKMGTTSAQKKLFFGLRRAKSKLEAYGEEALTEEQVTEIADKLGVKKAEVRDMNKRLSGQDYSLNATFAGGEEEGEWQDWLEDQSPDQEQQLVENDDLRTKRKLLRQALGCLTEREQKIFLERFLSDKPLTLAEIADAYGLSRERVRQIEVQAFEKVQKNVRLQAREQRISI